VLGDPAILDAEPVAERPAMQALRSEPDVRRKM
jgi:hypothetical protein